MRKPIDPNSQQVMNMVSAILIVLVILIVCGVGMLLLVNVGMFWKADREADRQDQITQEHDAAVDAHEDCLVSQWDAKEGTLPAAAAMDFCDTVAPLPTP